MNLIRVVIVPLCFAGLLLAGCQPSDQHTPGEDPLDAPTTPQRGAGETGPRSQVAPVGGGADLVQVQAQSPGAEQGAPQAQEGDEAQRLFEQHCAVCHTLDLPRSQRLDLATWREVIADMVDFGMTWLSEEENEKIAQYLAENYGRDTPR